MTRRRSRQQLSGSAHFFETDLRGLDAQGSFLGALFLGSCFEADAGFWEVWGAPDVFRVVSGCRRFFERIQGGWRIKLGDGAMQAFLWLPFCLCLCPLAWGHRGSLRLPRLFKEFWDDRFVKPRIPAIPFTLLAEWKGVRKQGDVGWAVSNTPTFRSEKAHLHVLVRGARCPLASGPCAH